MNIPRIRGILRTLCVEPIKQFYRLITDREYFTYNLLAFKMMVVPRFTETRIRVHGWELYIPDSASFLSAYGEIFCERIYNFKYSNPSPKVLDIGANIGISVLFFKTIYPKARIVALEPDPRIFRFLKKNVHGNGFTDVDLVNKAAWYENASLTFNSEGGDRGFVEIGGGPGFIGVDGVDIAEYLKKDRFDFIKIDIEGSEEFVFPACKEYLHKTQFLFIEYHSRVGRKQVLDEILHIMMESGSVCGRWISCMVLSKARADQFLYWLSSRWTEAEM